MPHDLQGGRHFKQAPAVNLWQCPACDADNFGPLEQGCSACGSGKPGKKVDPDDWGVSPVPTSTSSTEVQKSTSELEAPVDIAYRGWRKDHPQDSQTPLDLQLYAAFVAGFYAAQGRVQQQTVEPLTGTAESRTIVAALKLFRDQILSDLPEEVRSGEWLTPQAVDQLIDRLERTDG